MRKHTPGPWRVEGMGNASRAVWAGNRPICAVDFRSFDQEVVDANANLIAAAPDLLEACLQAEDLLAGYDITPDERRVLSSLQAAIAAAKGGAP